MAVNTNMPGTSANKKPSIRQRLIGIWNGFGRNLDNFISRMRAAWPQLAHRFWVVGASTTLLALSVMTASFLWPDSINYSLGRASNCINNPVFLPRLVRPDENEVYRIDFNGQRQIFGYPVYAAQTCTSLKRPLNNAEQKLTLKHMLLPVGGKQITINPPEAIEYKLGRPVDLPVATEGALVFHLSSPDITHSYRLSASKSSVICAPIDSALLCNLDNLGLKQNQRYVFKLERLFNQESVGLVLEHELETVEPVRIVKGSIKSGRTVQNIPTKLTLTANKNISYYAGIELVELAADTQKPVDATVKVNRKELEIIWAKPLKRRAKFELHLTELAADDKGYLTKPFVLRFETSGGPRVASVNIGGYGIGTYQSFVLWLDAKPKTGQNLNQFISVNGLGSEYSLSASGQQIIITPAGSWPRCTSFNIDYKDGLKNSYDVSGGSAWQFNSRTLCQQISTIGSSVDGRGIYAYRFGGGGNKIIYVGGTHGDEPGSVLMLNSWIDHLEANYAAIPPSETIIVVPNINPDGYVSGRRTNSNDVDLNRNFPANNWKKDVVMPGGQLNKGGGGKSPLSEPESSALASYVLGQNPELVLTYHAVGSLVIANESGNSSSLASTYAQHTGYWKLNNSETSGVFSHDTTGAFEDWLHDKHGTPALLIELSNYGVNEFWRHQSAMRTMAGF